MTYQLKYLSLRARGEPVRWILKAIGVDYREETIDIFKEWPSRKREFRFGKVPVLEVDGEQLHQTTVICRFLGEKHDLVSRDLWTTTRQMEVVEALHDLTNNMASALLGRVQRNEEKQRAMVGLAKAQFPVVMGNIEGRITDQGWILSQQMTWVDVFVAAYLDVYENYFPGVVAKFPLCEALRGRVQEMPAIKTWRQERPAWHPFEDPEGLVSPEGGS
ncbi:hematopoietic prostaglandin D synthase-like [Penaeus japonicus]|uniref:hematopoietic prostaglandin D synthase-like n=1 Tax=Penaeus japonicus TaxID=27405 RepID=UPI001C71191B|nr:hematopoietic prostaglandin D synthase-like [Penaeus japonicus]